MSDSGCFPFIPAWLDDAGLTQPQFRVLCHIARRGDCFAALPEIARVCRMCRETVQAAIKVLLDRGLVTKEDREGKTDIYRLAPSGKEGLGSPGTQRKGGATGQRKAGATHLAEKGGYKGTPIEGTPIKGEAPPAVGNENAEYRSLKDWQLRKDVEKLENRIQKERDSMIPDKELIRAMKAQLGKLHDEQKRRNRPTGTATSTPLTPIHTPPATEPFAGSRHKNEQEPREKSSATTDRPPIGRAIPHEEFARGCDGVRAVIDGQTEPEAK